MSEEKGKPNNENLPVNYDPYDMDLKKQFHPKADEKNLIGIPRKHPLLLCGAKRKGKTCKHVAGFGTSHPGYGRCKYHGGNNTGPKTKEGKAKVAKNSTIHGLASCYIRNENIEIFDTVTSDRAAAIKVAIDIQMTNILSYLRDHKEKYELYGRAGGKEFADAKSRVWYKAEGNTAYYHAGTIEDNPLDRAFNTLRRLIDSHAKLTQTTGDDLLASINQELRAASSGQVSLSWGGEAQKREQKE